MFKFDFNVDSESESEIRTQNDFNKQFVSVSNIEKCLDSKEIILKAELDNELSMHKLNSNTMEIGDMKLVYINPTSALNTFISLPRKGSDIQKAEESHTDLIPGIYEGGAKLWECTEDLLNYMESNFPHDVWNMKSVLDLGCGCGLLGIYTLRFHSFVHFQDYNEDVLKKITIPNVLLNSEFNILDKNSLLQIQSRTKFYSGDWSKYAALTEYDIKFDFILTSETVYNVQNYKKLLNTFAIKLKANGIILIAAKTYYFGVGGGLRQFEQLVKEDKRFIVRKVWISTNGVNREILELRRGLS